MDKSDVRKQMQMNAGFYKDALPNKQSFCDIDLVHEHNQHALMLEFFKHEISEYPPSNVKDFGQVQTLRTFNLLGVHVWYVGGIYLPTTTEGVYDGYPFFYNKLQKGELTEWVRCDLDSFKAELTKWNAKAHKTAPLKHFDD